jgi:hypothetical protein
MDSSSNIAFNYVEAPQQSYIPLILQVCLHLHHYHDCAFGPSTTLLKLDAWNACLRQTGHKSLWKLQTCRR